MDFSLRDHGFQAVRSVLTASQQDSLRVLLAQLEIAPGHRNLMHRVPEIASLATSPAILRLLAEAVGTDVQPVRSIFFDKTPSSNWKVPWHQDLSIAVMQQVDVAGFGPWSQKDGVLHVQPPVGVLESMVTLRLHLDDCDENSGALRVIPGSHTQGRLDADQIAALRDSTAEAVCAMKAGDALLMRPLLLHASSMAKTPSHRRVIHLEYATEALPGGLRWAESSALGAAA